MDFFIINNKRKPIFLIKKLTNKMGQDGGLTIRGGKA